MGPLWLDVAGCELTQEEKEILQHPSVGGVILFSRNYYDSKQLLALNGAIRSAAGRPLLIGVDQEGGRVQRFRDGFTLLPPAQRYAQVSDGEAVAKQAGWLMAAELIAHDIDLSFAPVLDCGHECRAIGDRAFGADSETVVRYSSAFLAGMKTIGMATTGKHFPGHGGVLEDSHLETPFDRRDDIVNEDMAIFKAQIEAGLLDAMMPAHVVYPHYDDKPASGSAFWLKQVLRRQLGFRGIVFSDDLNMEGASVMGGPAERAQQALTAGCDMLLMCNNRAGAVEILDNLPHIDVTQAPSLLKQKSFSLAELKLATEWKQAREAILRVLD